MTDFYKKTAEDQIKAPDVVKQPKYTGGGATEGEEAEGSEGSEGSSVGSKEGPESTEGSSGGGSVEEEGKFEYKIDPITPAEYQDMPEKEAKTFINTLKIL